AGELHAQVDDRHDDAAQVDHALDESRGVGDAGGLLVGADFLHLEDVDAVFLGTEAEGEELAAGGCRGAGGFVAGDLGRVVDHVHGVRPFGGAALRCYIGSRRENLSQAVSAVRALSAESSRKVPTSCVSRTACSFSDSAAAALCST